MPDENVWNSSKMGAHYFAFAYGKLIDFNGSTYYHMVYDCFDVIWMWRQRDHQCDKVCFHCTWSFAQ